MAVPMPVPMPRKAAAVDLDRRPRRGYQLSKLAPSVVVRIPARVIRVRSQFLGLWPRSELQHWRAQGGGSLLGPAVARPREVPHGIKRSPPASCFSLIGRTEQHPPDRHALLAGRRRLEQAGISRRGSFSHGSSCCRLPAGPWRSPLPRRQQGASPPTSGLWRRTARTRLSCDWSATRAAGKHAGAEQDQNQSPVQESVGCERGSASCAGNSATCSRCHLRPA